MTSSSLPTPEVTGSDIRVRFCPSPTGTPHIGMARAALFNWAYARHTGGSFVFRVEDTDAGRDSQQSFDELLDAMHWLGLDYDEGPDIGGPYAPYRQSERRAMHLEVAARQLAEGYANESYSTNEEVEARHRAAGRDPKLGYDNYDRDLSDEQRAAHRAGHVGEAAHHLDHLVQRETVLVRPWQKAFVTHVNQARIGL